jgi:hypothetical protein
VKEQLDVPGAFGLTETLEGEQYPLMPFASNDEIVTVSENPPVLVAVSWKLLPLPAVTLNFDGLVLSVYLSQVEG